MRIRRWCASGLAAGFAMLAVGCGWTARDQHLADHRVSIKPTRGDGSVRYSKGPDEELVPARTAHVAEYPDR